MGSKGVKEAGKNATKKERNDCIPPWLEENWPLPLSPHNTGIEVGNGISLVRYTLRRVQEQVYCIVCGKRQKTVQ